MTCPTCDGTGTTIYRGATRHGYDEPDYPGACGICGGTGELPAAMFSDEPAEDDDDDSLAWSV